MRTFRKKWRSTGSGRTCFSGLNTIEIHYLRSRERREDIRPLACHFLGVHSQRYRKQIHGFDPRLCRRFNEHTWAGNVRELNHVVERAVLMAQDNVIRLSDLALRAGSIGPPRLEEMSLEDVEAFLIKKALARYHGNVSQAAAALDSAEARCYRRLQRYRALIVPRRAGPSARAG